MKQVLVLILDIALAVCIIRITRTRQQMFRSGGGSESSTNASGSHSASGSNRELNAAIVILVMAALPLTIYIPNAIFWGTYIFGSLLPNWNPNLSFFLVVLGRITISVSIIVHLWNIYLYAFRISDFRAELFRLLSCGNIRVKLSHSQYSQSVASEKL